MSKVPSYVIDIYEHKMTILPFCRNHEVACGSYDCNYADIKDNTIVCTATDCIYQSSYNNLCINNNRTVVDNYENSLNDEDIVDYPF